MVRAAVVCRTKIEQTPVSCSFELLLDQIGDVNDFSFLVRFD